MIEDLEDEDKNYLLELSNSDFADGIAELIKFVMDGKDTKKSSYSLFTGNTSEGGDAVSDRLSSFTYE